MTGETESHSSTLIYHALYIFILARSLHNFSIKKTTTITRILSKRGGKDCIIIWPQVRNDASKRCIVDSHCCLQVQPSQCLCSVRSSLWHCLPSPSCQPSREGIGVGKHGNSSRMGSTHIPPHQGIQAQNMNRHICLPEFVLMLIHCKDS